MRFHPVAEQVVVGALRVSMPRGVREWGVPDPLRPFSRETRNHPRASIK